MKLSTAEQETLVALMGRIYLDIRDIEEEYHLLAGEGDFRPRIEHFHDAIRAYTSQPLNPQASESRLSVEWLAYDMACLRYITSMPLSPFKPKGARQSAGTQVLAHGSKELAAIPKRPDRMLKQRISELYQHYAVLFAGLLKPLADTDSDIRVQDLNQDIKEIHNVIQTLEKMGKGAAGAAELADAVAHLEEDDLRLALTGVLRDQRYKKKDDRKAITQTLKERITSKDKQIAAIDKAHTQYAMAQLAVFESSKDVIKKMAAQGMNIVGRFVAEAAAETKRQMGR